MFVLLTKTIKISEDTHKSLSDLASKDDTFDDVIVNLIDYFHDNEEFSDEQAKFYNEEIERIENGIFENVHEVSLSDLEKRISKLEAEIGK